MKKLVKIENLLKVTMQLNLFLMASLFLMSSAQANTVNTVIDIIEMQTDALLETSNKALNKLSTSLFYDITNAIAVEEIDAYAPNFDDKNALVDAVEKVHRNLGAKAKLTNSLNSIVNTIEKSSEMKNAYKSLKNLGISVRKLEKSANDLFELIKSEGNLKLLKDLSVNGKDEIDALLSVVKSGSDLHNFISKINSTDNTSLQKNYAIKTLLNQTKIEAANFLKKGLRDEVDQKLFIQHMIVKTWKNSGFIDADNYKEFAKITVYDEDLPTGIFFRKRTIGNSLNANNKYPKEYFDSDDSDYQYEGWSSQPSQSLVSINKEIERNDEKEKIESIKQKMQAEDARKQRHEKIKQEIRAKQRANAEAETKLRSGNYAFGTIIGGNFSRNSGSQSGFIGVDTTPSVDGGTVDRYLFGYARNILPVIRNGNSTSIGLSFDNLKESVSSNSSGNASLVSSDRIRAHSEDYGDYSYIAWGSWAGGENTRYRNYDRIRGGHWIYGQRLGTVDIPKSGSARYIGQVRGNYVNRDRATVEMNSITGDINMNFTFRDSNFSLSGVMNLDRNGEDWATARFNRQNARSGNIFRTSLKVQGGGRGQLRGSFFGANAAEAGGSFAVNKDGIAVGVYRAKKQ